MEFRVKKRTNERINEVTKILKPVDFVPNQYGDRFIPRRYAQSSSSRFKTESTAAGDTDLMRMERKDYWKSQAFAAVFQDVFKLSPGSARILNFHDVTNQQICGRVGIRKPMQTYLEPTYKNAQKLDWSCKPRSKPLAFIESVHDLPRIRMMYSNVIDWSAKGQIAAIFSKKLVVWVPNTESTIAYNALNTTGIAFNPTGDKLVIASYHITCPMLYLMEGFGTGKITKSKSMLLEDWDVISCLTWDSTGQYIVCGTGCGQLVVVRTSDFMIRQGISFPEQEHVDRVSIVRFSPTSKYLASSDEAGHLYIWAWKNGHVSPLTVWISNCKLALFDWHPWREDEIVIADSEPVTIALFHVPSRKVLSFHRRRNPDCLISALAFNKVSGELVISYSYPDPAKDPELLVLASMDRVVDILANHEDMVGNILWSPDGMQLASASYDEALTIWNFFGTAPPNKSDMKPATAADKGDGQQQQQHRHHRQQQHQLQQQQHRNHNRAPIGGFDYAYLYKPMR